MSKNSNAKRSVGRQMANPPRGEKTTESAAGLALPHERDESTDASGGSPDPIMAQAKRDIDAGMVDTDMRATSGLDVKLPARMVPGPGGKAPSEDARSLRLRRGQDRRHAPDHVAHVVDHQQCAVLV